jgi:hypothetical protein
MLIDFFKNTRTIAVEVGMWRSLVAHCHGVAGVESSNLSIPTN